MKNRGTWPERTPAPTRHGRAELGRGWAVEPVMVSARAACRLLGDIDEKTLRAWRQSGLLDGTWCKLGGRVLFDLNALRHWSARACIDLEPRPGDEHEDTDRKEA